MFVVCDAHIRDWEPRTVLQELYALLAGVQENGFLRGR